MALSTPAQASNSLNGVLFSRGGVPGLPGTGYDYGASIIRTGNTEQIWWCGDGPNPNGGQSDVIYYRTRDLSTNTFTPIQQVFAEGLAPSWDSAYTCDPSVIKGPFTYHSVSYAYALYYTGTDDPVGNNNRVGLAFSNDGVSWVRYANASGVGGPGDPSAGQCDLELRRGAAVDVQDQLGSGTHVPDRHLARPRGRRPHLRADVVQRHQLRRTDPGQGAGARRVDPDQHGQQ